MKNLLLQNAVKSSRLIQTVHPNQSLRPLLSASAARHFTTEPQSRPNQQSSSSGDPFFQTPKSGLFYGKLSGVIPKHGITKQTLKSDVIRILDDNNLSPDDLKFHYDWRYEPTGVMIQFSSPAAYDAAFRQARRNQFYKLEKIDRSHWDSTRPYDGKYVLLKGLSRTTSIEDIDRFLSGTEFDSTAFQFITRQDSFPNPIKMALVRFPSLTLAMNAFITKNRSYCLNDQILMQVLH